MPNSTPLFRAALAGATMLVLAGSAVPASAMGSRHHMTENNLSAAGFKVRIADTPERRTMLARLPVHKVLMRQHKGTVHYVYADPQGCHCLYVGDQRAYQHYTSELQKDRRVNQQAFAAQQYNDASWDWGRWGGDFGPGFGYEPGFGW